MLRKFNQINYSLFSKNEIVIHFQLKVGKSYTSKMALPIELWCIIVLYVKDLVKFAHVCQAFDHISDRESEVRMVKVDNWDDYGLNCNAYRQCTETFNRCRVACSLSAVASARIPIAYPGYYGRECDAICDIEIICNNNVSHVGMEMGSICVSSEKINGEWDIKHWFTLDKPLLVVCMPLIREYLTMGSKYIYDYESNVTVNWKQIRYRQQKRDRLCKKTQTIDYNKCAITYCDDGRVCTYTYDEYIQLHKDVKVSNSIDFS